MSLTVVDVRHRILEQAQSIVEKQLKKSTISDSAIVSKAFDLLCCSENSDVLQSETPETRIKIQAVAYKAIQDAARQEIGNCRNAMEPYLSTLHDLEPKRDRFGKWKEKFVRDEGEKTQYEARYKRANRGLFFLSKRALKADSILQAPSTLLLPLSANTSFPEEGKK